MPFDIKDPSALLRPFKNLQQFTEELYAMFSKSVSPEPNVKAVRGKAPGEPPQPSRRSDVNSDALPSVASVRSSRLTEARSKAPSEISRTSTHKESRPRDTAKVEAPEPRREPIAHNEHFLPEIKIGAQHEKPRRSETVNRVTSFSVVDPPPASSARKPQDRSRPAPDQKRHDEPRVDHPERKPRNDDSAESRLLDIGNFATVSGGSAASSVYIGRVVSGSGDTYTVDLYATGIASPASDTVTVTIPMIDPEETIAPGTWINPIFQLTDADGNDTYVCQVPVWVE